MRGIDKYSPVESARNE